jgi:hypothetical protein
MEIDPYHLPPEVNLLQQIVLQLLQAVEDKDQLLARVQHQLAQLLRYRDGQKRSQAASACASSPLPIFAICSHASAPTRTTASMNCFPRGGSLCSGKSQALTKKRKGASGASFWRKA